MTAPRPDHGSGNGSGRLADPVRRQCDRRRRWRAEGERPMGRNLALIGSLGWLIVVPTLAGLFLGRWLDGGSGRIFWTLSLLVAGLAWGCWMAWLRIRQEDT
ncbi:AtpZ/AtpI family protein [Azospirillum sp. ST 5-10]|uniref:AtpZ/AtpI family protein n=1 Tax=unclassified Azospirillum TaxID=2630922 RepID=UPI003F4A1417